jgi:predicted Holliday junction resolvase-like endonuclease
MNAKEAKDVYEKAKKDKDVYEKTKEKEKDIYMEKDINVKIKDAAADSYTGVFIKEKLSDSITQNLQDKGFDVYNDFKFGRNTCVFGTVIKWDN